MGRHHYKNRSRRTRRKRVRTIVPPNQVIHFRSNSRRERDRARRVVWLAEQNHRRKHGLPFEKVMRKRGGGKQKSNTNFISVITKHYYTTDNGTVGW